ncbi:MAG: FTR1 family protein [Candidatus Bathyarchaeia archaeon]
MFGQYLITFRETLEAALIAAIILSYLARSGRHGLTRYVWYGISSAVVASLSISVIVWFTYGILPDTFRLLFEALAAFIAVAVLSFMIYWMAVKGRHIREETEKHVERAASRSAIIGLSSLGFIVVFREGFETVLFLTPFLLNDAIATLTGMLLGILTAVLLAYGIFVAGMKINLQRFFYLTSVMLILLAGGLAGYGTHELLEYYEETGFKAGWLSESAYALNIPADSPLHHKGVIGSIFAVLFGYTVSAEWARIIVHISYLAIALPLVMWVYRKNIVKA